MMLALRELWKLWRDKFTGWWLIQVCDCPYAAHVFAEEILEQLGGTRGRP